MDGLTYGIADCIGSQRDLDDVQMDGKVDIVSAFEENLDVVINLAITDDCKLNQDVSHMKIWLAFLRTLQ